jgi:hypothetical protein
MANRLLPFRQYNEHFVVNLFALKTSELNLTDPAKNTHANSDKHDAGVLVKPSAGILDLGAGYGGSGANAGEGSSDLNTYMGSTDYPHVGRNVNPEAFGKFEVAGASDDILGVTLNQTLAWDENGEKMLYYRQKLLEHQGVLPGEVVPVLTKGIITVAASAIAGTAPTIGAIVNAAAEGKFSKDAGTKVGLCIGKGNRNGVYDANQKDYFAGDGTSDAGNYYIIKIDL